MRILLAVLIILLHASFLHAEEPSFKISFGSKVGNIPFEINKMSKNKKTKGGIKINSWNISPNFSSFEGFKKIKELSKDKNFEEKFYIKLKLKF